MIVVHNHPSGNPAPSDDDIAITKDLVASGKLLGIEVLDHLIVGSGHGYTSFGGLVAGYANEVNAPSSSVSGGTGNAANGVTSSISGGTGNIASGWASSVTGGKRNLAIGDSSSVTGGLDNQTISNVCTLSGGMGVTLEERPEGYWMVGQLKSKPEPIAQN